MEPTDQPTFVNPTCPKNFPHFDLSVVGEFILWALRGECVFETTSPTIMHDFHAAIRTLCGENWLDTWWSTIRCQEPTLDSRNGLVHGYLKPSSFLEFAMQVELFTFSEIEISREISRNPEVPRSPKLLYYLLIGNARSDWNGFPFEYHNTKQWQDFARFLLRSDFDPNIPLEVDVGPDRGHLMDIVYRDNGKSDKKSGSEDGNEDGDEEFIEDEHDIISKDQDSDAPENRRPITAMHLALAIACSSSLYSSDLMISHLEMLAILVEGGGNANVLNYRNYWSHQEGDATERSAIHYLLSSSYDKVKPFHHPEPEVNRALSQCIIAFLNHGADPNAVDSNGVSILELALPICPYALVELMLEKGAQVTPKLLSESGAPLDYADGILNESRWRIPECYTPVARVIARNHNTHWEDLEVEKQGSEQEQVLWQDTGNILSTVGGYFANLAGSVKRRL
jgi:ankyrin repeat protein